MAMMAITTSSSISVKPPFLFLVLMTNLSTKKSGRAGQPLGSSKIYLPIKAEVRICIQTMSGLRTPALIKTGFRNARSVSGQTHLRISE